MKRLLCGSESTLKQEKIILLWNAFPLSEKMLLALVFTLIFFPFSSAQALQTDTFTHTPSVLENEGSSAEPQNDSHATVSSDKYDGYGINETEVFGLEGNETNVRSQKPVLRKCCHFGQELTESGCEVTQNHIPFYPIVYHGIPEVLGVNDSKKVDDIFNLEFGDTCQYGRYRLEPLMDPKDEFYLLDNGSLLLPADSVVLPGAEEFCMEIFIIDEEENKDAVVLPLVCFPPPIETEPNDEELKWILYPLGMLLSVPFLLMILIAHILVAKLRRTIQGKSLMCHVFSLTIAYVGLAIIQLSKSTLPIKVCVSIAFAVQFAFIACFAWLNILCFDLWRRTRKASSYIEAPRRSSQKKVMFPYSIYAMVCPILINVVSMVMDLTPSIPAAYIKPQFGVASCWFLTDDAALPYFFGPIGLMIFGNLVLFILTAINIFRYNNNNPNTSKNKQEEGITSSGNLKRNIKLCFRLYVLMGISWTVEIISWATGNNGGKLIKIVWYVTDVCNSLQGVFIFIIFILDSGFRYLVKEKFKQCWLGSDDLNGGHAGSQPEVSVLL